MNSETEDANSDKLKRLKQLAEEVVIPMLDANIHDYMAMAMLDEIISHLELMNDSEATKVLIALRGVRSHVCSMNEENK